MVQEPRDGLGRVGQRSPHRRVRALPCDGLHPKPAGKVPCAQMTGCTRRCRGTCQPLTPRVLLGRTGLSCCSCVVVHGLGIPSLLSVQERCHRTEHHHHTYPSSPVAVTVRISEQVFLGRSTDKVSALLLALRCGRRRQFRFHAEHKANHELPMFFHMEG